MDDTTPGRCHKRVRAQSGDVDENGEIVGQLRERLSGAIGETVNVNREIHLRRIEREIHRARTFGARR